LKNRTPVIKEAKNPEGHAVGIGLSGGGFVMSSNAAQDQVEINHLSINDDSLPDK
jgi:hypothetical protein